MPARPPALSASTTRYCPSAPILVAYSDGLVERRGTDLDDQLAPLQRVVDKACDPAAASTAQQVAASILNALIPDADHAEDDVCLLTVRRLPR